MMQTSVKGCTVLSSQVNELRLLCLPVKVARHPPLYGYYPASPLWHYKQATTVQSGKQDAPKEKFVEAVKQALQLDKRQRPSEDDWLGGPHRDRVLALMEYGIRQGTATATRNLAMESLRLCDLPITPNGAVLLLEVLNVLPLHAPLAVYRAGISTAFPEELESVAQVWKGPVVVRCSSCSCSVIGIGCNCVEPLSHTPRPPVQSDPA